MMINNVVNNTSRIAIWRVANVLLLTSVLVLLLAACATSKTPRLIQWDHPLVGKIWDVKQQRFIDQTALAQQMLTAEYLMLGEQHDNRRHHEHQIWAIQQLQQAGRQVSVAFEMIDDEQGAFLAKHRIDSAEKMISILSLVRNGWDYENRYRDLFAQVIAAGYPITGANLNRQKLKQVVKQGEEKLPPAYKKMLAQTPLPAAQMRVLQQTIKQSHCNMLDDKSVTKMVLAQRVRDAVMTHSLLKNKAPMKVLIAGGGHVRNDRGVPLYLAKQIKTARIFTVGFIEVSAGVNDIAHYAEHWGGDTLPFDAVWFTPEAERGDMCAGFIKSHKAKQEKAATK